MGRRWGEGGKCAGERVEGGSGRGRQKGMFDLQAETEKPETCNCVVLFKVLEYDLTMSTISQ